MINCDKICFITCVSDERMYEELLLYIQRLYVPVGMQVECIAIREASSMVAGYNQGMKMTDAKYKVYLHQDVFIVHLNFIQDILDVFKMDTDIGILGMVGAKHFSKDGVWWHIRPLLGAIYDNHHIDGMMKYLYEGNENQWNDAAALDGLLLATQYDIPWREDVFSYWHFYDVSQCMEFQRNAYKRVVVGQKNPWCIHRCQVKRTLLQYEGERRKFLAEYRTDLMPLVSVLMVVEDNPDFFEKSLSSLLGQTYKNMEILVLDKSKTGEIAERMDGYRENRCIKYYCSRELKDRTEEDPLLKIHARGEFLQVVADCTVFDKEKIEKMVQCFLLNENVKLVTAKCRTLDENGDKKNSGIIIDFGTTKKCIIISGTWLCDNLLMDNIDFIESIDDVMFRCEDSQDTFDLVLNKDDRYKFSLWEKLLQKGDCGYFQEYLCTRQVK